MLLLDWKWAFFLKKDGILVMIIILLEEVGYANNIGYDKAFEEIINFNKDYNGLPDDIKQLITHRTKKLVNEKIYFILDIKAKKFGHGEYILFQISCIH